MSLIMKESMNCQSNAFDLNKLCKLVKENPVIWDNTLTAYRSAKYRKKAWGNVFKSLIPEFKNLEGKKRIKLADAVKQKWTLLRKRYNYDKALQCANELKFLEKVKKSKKSKDNFSNEEEFLGPEDSFQPSKGKTITEAHAVSLAIKDEIVQKSHIASKTTSKKLEHETQESGFSNSLDFFFQSIMPQLNRFSNAEYIEFQVGFLQVITNIYERRKQNTPLKLYPQTPSIGEPHSSCSKSAKSS